MTWKWLTLADVLIKQSNGKPVQQGWSPQCHTHPATDGHWGVLKTTAIQEGRFDPLHNKELPDDLEPRPWIEIKPGDLLMTCAGPRTRCGVPALVRSTPERLLMSGKMYRFRPDERVLPGFLEMWLLNPDTQKQIDGMKTGISDSGLNLTHGRFVRLPIPVPPLAEQYRILAMLEDQMSRVEVADATLRQARARLVRLEALSFEQAARGRAVLGSTTVGDLCEVFVGMTPSRSNPDFWKGELPWVSSGEVAFNRITDTREKIDRKAAGNPNTRIHPPGTVMIAMIGEGKTRGQVAILDIEAAHNQNCASIRIDRSKLLPEFVYHSLRSRYEQNRSMNAAGGVQPALNKSKVQQLPLPLLSLKDQRAVVDEVEASGHLGQRLADVLDGALLRSAALRRSLLRAAFNGELVDQDQPEVDP